MVHVAVIGTGRTGGQVAFSVAFERYVTELSLVDIAPNVAAMMKEELCHALAAHGFDLKINAHESSKSLKGADLIIVAAGFPRTPDMSRRDLATKNASAVEQAVKDTLENNPEARYFIITNPVDAMATLANKAAEGKRHIIGTGTNLETSRLRTIVSRELDVPLSLVEGYAAGEHGEATVLLWSTVKVDGLPLEEFSRKTGKKLDRGKCENYVKEVSRQVITYLGGTRYGPAGSFIEIIRGLLLNTGKVLAYSRPLKFDTIPEQVYVTVPARMVKSLGPDIWHWLTKEEQQTIKEAAGQIYKTYIEAVGETG
jgi:malate/lactate dehydrogenase